MRTTPVTFDAASKPILFLLDREFEDGQIPGQRFFCRHSLLLEGALSSIDGLDAQLDVRRIGFARPRREVIAEIGEQDQSLPKLVLPQACAANWPVARTRIASTSPVPSRSWPP